MRKENPEFWLDASSAFSGINNFMDDINVNLRNLQAVDRLVERLPEELETSQTKSFQSQSRLTPLQSQRI